MILLISMLLPSANNLREHWRARGFRVKAQRMAVTLAMRTQRRLLLELHGELARGGTLVVTLTRVAPRFLDDDNLQGAFKAVRDGIAKELGCTDGPSGPLSWLYFQTKPDAKASPGIRVVIMPPASAAVAESNRKEKAG